MRWTTRTGLTLLIATGMLQSWCILAESPAIATQTQTTPQAAGAGISASPDSEHSSECKPENGVVPPKLIYAPVPEFTDKARRKKLTGTCVLSMLVDAQGNPHQVDVVKSIADGLNPKLRSAAVSLDQNAINAAQQYHFEPATRQGKPVSCKLKIEVAFRIY